MGWKSIGTAPTDNSQILVGFYDEDTWCWDCVIARPHEFDGDTFGFSRSAAPYTHWMVPDGPPESGIA